jgi:chitinase
LTKSSFFSFDPPPKPLVLPLNTPPNEYPSWCPAEAPPSRRVVLFWQTERDGCEMIPLGVTHVVWGYALVDKNNIVGKNFQGNDDTLRSCIVSLRRRCIRSFVSIGGATNLGNLTTIQNPKKFAQSALELVKEYTFDGVDVDDEVVVKDGFKEENFITYMKELHNVLKTNGNNYVLTADLMVGEIAPECKANEYERCFVSEIVPYVDWVHIMAYNVAKEPQDSMKKYKRFQTKDFPDFIRALGSKEKLSIGFCLGKACAYGIGPPDDVVDSWIAYSRANGGMMIYSGNQDIDHDFAHTRKTIKLINQ